MASPYRAAWMENLATLAVERGLWQSILERNQEDHVFTCARRPAGSDRCGPAPGVGGARDAGAQAFELDWVSYRLGTSNISMAYSPLAPAREPESVARSSLASPVRGLMACGP